MNYQLAKQLKDAGYSQQAKMGGFISDQTGNERDVYAPTLSELIEACGDRFSSLIYESTNSDEKWEVREITIGNEFGLNNPNCSGKTPEEAVAKLWLALNKKQ